MKSKPSAILQTVKTIFSSDQPLTISQITKRTKLSHRTIQRHTKKLLDEGMVEVARSERLNQEYCYQRAF